MEVLSEQKKRKIALQCVRHQNLSDSQKYLIARQFEPPILKKAKVIAADKYNSVEFLKRAGILNEHGHQAKEYAELRNFKRSKE